MAPSPEREPEPEPAAAAAALRDVVALMYRADWTALSLSATVSCWTDRELRSRPGGAEVRPGGSPATQKRILITLRNVFGAQPDT
jgi:hypothetical protein